MGPSSDPGGLFLCQSLCKTLFLQKTNTGKYNETVTLLTTELHKKSVMLLGPSSQYSLPQDSFPYLAIAFTLLAISNILSQFLLSFLLSLPPLNILQCCFLCLSSLLTFKWLPPVPPGSFLSPSLSWTWTSRGGYDDGCNAIIWAKYNTTFLSSSDPGWKRQIHTMKG